jgi:hypothetical protein
MEEGLEPGSVKQVGDVQCRWYLDESIHGIVMVAGFDARLSFSCRPVPATPVAM